MKNEQILQISPDDLIEREGWNVRLADDPDNIAHIAELAESIFHVGVLEPLSAYAHGPSQVEGPVKYTVENGHCRLAAVRQAIARGAPIKSVPVRLTDKRANDADHNFAMVARNSGKALSQLEFGLVCKRLTGFGWSETDLAQKTGYSAQHIRNCLTLASAPEEITKLVETGQVSASLATQAIAAEGVEGASETLQAAVQVAKAEDAAKPKKPSKKGVAKRVEPVKATLKHVSKVKGVAPKQGTKKAQYSKKPATESADEIADRIVAMPAVRGLMTLDKLGKNRAEAFESIVLMARAWTKHLEAGADRDDGVDVVALASKLGRALDAVDDADPAISTIVIGTEDWREVCRLLKIKQPMEKDDRRLHAM